MKNIIKKAMAFAIEKHAGQRYNNGPFVTHPFETAKIIQSLPHLRQDTNLIVAAILHDTLEDTNTTRGELIEEFNFDVADLVLEVTKTKYNTFPNLKTQRGVLLKFADRLDNLSHMEDWSEIKQEKYILKSKFWK